MYKTVQRSPAAASNQEALYLDKATSEYDHSTMDALNTFRDILNEDAILELENAHVMSSLDPFPRRLFPDYNY